MLQIVFKMTINKLTVCRLLLTGSQLTRRFIHSHLFLHSHEDGLTNGQTTLMRMFKIRKLHLKLHLKKLHLKYMLGVETVTKGF